MKQINKCNSQLVAHCFFSVSGVSYQNYDKYYQDEEKHILDMIEDKYDY